MARRLHTHARPYLPLLRYGCRDTSRLCLAKRRREGTLRTRVPLGWTSCWVTAQRVLDPFFLYSVSTNLFIVSTPWTRCPLLIWAPYPDLVNSRFPCCTVSLRRERASGNLLPNRFLSLLDRLGWMMLRKGEPRFGHYPSPSSCFHAFGSQLGWTTG